MHYCAIPEFAFVTQLCAVSRLRSRHLLRAGGVLEPRLKPISLWWQRNSQTYSSEGLVSPLRIRFHSKLSTYHFTAVRGSDGPGKSVPKKMKRPVTRVN